MCCIFLQLQAARLHCVNWCCKVKLILLAIRKKKKSSPLLYFWRLLFAISGGHWPCDLLQPIRTGQFAWSLLSSGNIRNLLQKHEQSTYSCCIHVVFYWVYPWRYVCDQGGTISSVFLPIAVYVCQWAHNSPTN